MTYHSCSYCWARAVACRCLNSALPGERESAGDIAYKRKKQGKDFAREKIREREREGTRAHVRARVRTSMCERNCTCVDVCVCTQKKRAKPCKKLHAFQKT